VVERERIEESLDDIGDRERTSLERTSMANVLQEYPSGNEEQDDAGGTKGTLQNGVKIAQVPGLQGLANTMKQSHYQLII
jgi:hypothetical protein